MRRALEQLRAHLERPQKKAGRSALFWVTVLCALTSFAACSAVSAWRDYAAASPVRATVLERQMEPPGFPTPGTLFGTVMRYRVLVDGREETVDQPIFSDGLEEVKFGEPITLWLAPGRGFATDRLRLPIALTTTPVLFLCLGLLFLRPSPKNPTIRNIAAAQARGETYDPARYRETWSTDSKGSTRVTLQARHRLSRSLILLIGLPASCWLVLYLCLGLLAAFFQSEAMARTAKVVGPEPLVSFALWGLTLMLAMKSRLEWNSSKLWIDGRRFERSAIRRVALVPSGDSAMLQIRHDGSRRPLIFRGNELWAAGVLEKLGYEIEVSEKPL